ncbi:MAG: winged helix-turn-helix domain-containing protein [Litoreibacter sp.]
MPNINTIDAARFCSGCGEPLFGFSPLVYGNITMIDFDKVFIDEKHVALSQAEHRLVEALVRAKGMGVTRSTLASFMGGDIFDQTVTVLVRRARIKFRSVVPGFDQVSAIRGFGAYRWSFKPS